MLVENLSKYSISEIMGHLKGTSSQLTFKEFVDPFTGEHVNKGKK